MLVTLILLLLGFTILIKGADLLVKGASSLAKRLRVSELIIGLTIVAFGTSAPELVVNIIASDSSYHEVVVGNVVGSNLFNLLLILGVSGIICPIKVQVGTIWKEVPFSLFTCVLLFVLVNDTMFFNSVEDKIGLVDSLILLFLFGIFIFSIFRSMQSENEKEIIDTTELSKIKTILYILFGLSGLIVGGHFVVNKAVVIARYFSLSEKLIGLTIISVGTSLPELATSLVAALKKKSDMAIGNVIGSNIFNVLLVLGVSSIVSPIKYNTSFNFDIGLLIGSTLLLFFAMFTGIRQKLDRWESLILLVLFFGYMVFLIRRG